ncbi:MAG TPA: ribonuclease P protein component [Dehalococcoidia bacterium]|jgi:ribonuclease P protein component|nr:ribonuclease P protein component [Dehalococcoidia bacterium]
MAAVRRGEQRLRRGADVIATLRRGRRTRTHLLRVNALDNGLSHNRYGFAVSSRVGNSVVRNHTKRQLREIVHQVPTTPGHDVLVTANEAVTTATFKELTRAFATSCEKLSIYNRDLRSSL